MIEQIIALKAVEGSNKMSGSSAAIKFGVKVHLFFYSV